MKIGDKIVCENKHMYTLGRGNDFYTFSLIDEFGEEVNSIMDYALQDCLPEYEEDQQSLCIGYGHDGKLNYTRIMEYIEC